MGEDEGRHPLLLTVVKPPIMEEDPNLPTRDTYFPCQTTHLVPPLFWEVILCGGNMYNHNFNSLLCW